MPERQRPHEHAVDDAEHRRVDADAEREREQRDRGDARAPAPRSQTESKVLPQLLEHASLSSTLCGTA